MRQVGTGRKLREGNIISNSFMIYLFAPCDCRRIFNHTAGWPARAHAACCGTQNSSRHVNPPFASGFPPHTLLTPSLALCDTQQ